MKTPSRVIIQSLLLALSISTATAASAWPKFFSSAKEAPAGSETSASAPQADPTAKRAIARLMKYPDRPTMNDILRELGGPVEGNPFLDEFKRRSQDRNFTSYSNLDQIRATILKATRSELPGQIAALERAFPGARFSPLGRDAAPYGDALDAFYVSIGQTDRLARINGSGNTIRSAGDDGLVKMLKSLGFDIAKGAQQRPLLLMDRTSYASHGNYSQTGYIMSALYKKYRAMKKDPSDLPRVLNVIGLSSNGVKLDDRANDFDAFLKKASQDTKNPDENGYFDRLPREMLGVADASAFIDHGLWHQGYSNVGYQPNGRYEGAPGAVADEAERLGALAEMYAVYQVVSKPSFLAAVKRKARMFGYVFRTEYSSEPLEVKPVDPKARYEEIEKELKELIAGLPKSDDVEKKYFSDNAADIAYWIDQNKGTPGGYIDSNQVSLMSIWNITQARGERKIGKKDYRRLLAKTFEMLDVSDKTTIAHFKAMIKEHPRLESILSTRAWSFSAKATHNYEVVSKKFEVIKKEILVPMGCDLVLTPPTAKTSEDPGKESTEPGLL